MKQNESDEWLAQLSGREPAHPDSKVARLRRIMLESEARLHRQIESTHESDAQAVLRLRRSLQSAQFGRPSALRRWGLPLALAASVLAAAAFYLQQFGYLERAGEPSRAVPLGDRTAHPQPPPQVIRLAVADPRAAAESLREELDRAEILSHLSSDEDGYYLFVVVGPGTAPAVIGKDLVEGGIKLEPGRIRVEIVPQ